jgi:methylaspartate mutase epsilon subunit
VRESVREWSRACRLFLRLRDERGIEPHLESFGGCMLGQLCPPGLLVAITVLECLFFQAHGLRSVSLSYAQQTSPDQDLEALGALRILAGEYLDEADWHSVLNTYMGLYPESRDGALRLLCDSAELAVRGGADRLIVKTSAEAVRVPSVAENVEALELAAAVAAATRRGSAGPAPQDADTGVLAEARALIEAVLDLHRDLGQALGSAVERGLLDVPWCLHPDNAGRTRSRITREGTLAWSDTGSLPVGPATGRSGAGRVGSSDLLAALSYVRNRYDAQAGPHPALGPGGGSPSGGASRPRITES